MDFLNQLDHYLYELIFLLPISVIGAWRWGTWLFKKLVGFFYRPVEGLYEAEIGIITPVYNEEPDLFRAALKSWRQNRVDEIIAVIDYTDERSIGIFKKFAKKFKGAKLIVTHTPGKREALADGIKASKSEILALVDSDVVWENDIKSRMLAPFADPTVGGVAVRQDMLKADTFAKKIFKMHLSLRFLNEFPFLAVVGNAFTVLSGRTAVYRRKAIAHLTDRLVKETFWGKKVISGDDKRLTSLVQAEGWKCRYLGNIRVFTSGSDELSFYLKQRLRWSRNSWRSDLKTLFSRWVWKREKFLALYLLDRLFPPFTLLLGPVFLITALIYHHYEAVLIFIGWLLFSRFVKLIPYFREDFRSVTILPAYILFSYLEALVKIYALVTLNQQGWITRWSKDRLRESSFLMLKEGFSVVVTLLFPALMLWGGIAYENNRIAMAEAKKVAREQKIKEEEQKRLNDPKGATFEITLTEEDYLNQPNHPVKNIRQEILDGTSKEKFAFYRLKQGETLESIRRKFNLRDLSVIQWVDGPTNFFAVPALIGRQIKIPFEELRNPIDRKIVSVPTTLQKITYDPLTNTINVVGKGSVLTPLKIRNALPLNQRFIIEETAPMDWILRANLYLDVDTTLLLTGEEVKSFRLLSEPDKTVWIRSENGNILIQETKISSWSERENAPDKNNKDGRAYITAKGSGRMDILDSELSYLGSAGTERRGGLFGGSYGVSWKIENGSFRDSLTTGVVRRNKIHHNYFGLYSYGATGLEITDNEVYENDEYGLDPHDDSNNLLIENNLVHHNGNHGIIISKRCFNNIIRKNISRDNKLHGIMMDRQSNNNLVVENLTRNNADGVAVYDSYNNYIANNRIMGNRKSGVRMNMHSAENLVWNNVFNENNRGVYLYGETGRNYIFENKIKNNRVGIVVKDSAPNYFQSNLRPEENRKDVLATEASKNHEFR